MKELKNLLTDNVSALEVSILINNAGVLHFGQLENKKVEELRTMVNVNVNAQTYISILMLP